MADVFYPDDKQPGEILTWAVEYRHKLLAGESLTTIASSGAIRLDTGADVSATVVAAVNVVGTQVRIRVQAGTNLVKHKAFYAVNTNSGNRFEADFIFLVKEY
jgi:hypothetical protein